MLKLEAGQQYPPGDPALSPLGRRQAAWLGECLAREGFQGAIFSSPYRRTLETAQIVAETTGRSVIPEPALQEVVRQDGCPDFEELDACELRRLFPRVDLGVSLSRPWLVEGPETESDVQERVQGFYEILFASKLEDVLLVGHGATVHACIRLLAPDHISESQADVVSRNWNCALTTLRAMGRGEAALTRLFEVKHIPPEFVTSNDLYKHVG